MYHCECKMRPHFFYTSRRNLVAIAHRTSNGGCQWKYSLAIHLHIICWGNQMKRSHFCVCCIHAFAMQCTTYPSRCNAQWFISGCLYSTDVEWNQQPKDCYDARVIALNCSCWLCSKPFVLRLTFAANISNNFIFGFVVCKRTDKNECT